jgi:hypothetical protein
LTAETRVLFAWVKDQLIIAFAIWRSQSGLFTCFTIGLDFIGNNFGLGKTFFAITSVSVNAFARVGTFVVATLGPWWTVVKIEDTLVDVDTVVRSIALVPVLTLAGGFHVGLRGKVNYTVSSGVTLFITANVVDTFTTDLILHQPISACALITAVSVDTLLICTRTQCLVKFTLVNVEAFTAGKSVAFVSVGTLTVNTFGVLRDAIGIHRTCWVFQIDTTILNAAISIAEVIFIAFTLETTGCVNTFGIWATIMTSNGTLVDVNTLKPIAIVTVGTVTWVTAIVVGTCGNFGTLMLHIVTLIHINAQFPIALEAGCTFAFVTAECVDTEATSSSTVMLTCLALIEVLTRDSITLESIWAWAWVTADGILALGQSGTAVVLLLEALVLVVARVSIAPEAVLAFTLERGRRLRNAISVLSTIIVLAGSRLSALNTRANESVFAIALELARHIGTCRIAMAVVQLGKTLVNIRTELAVALETGLTDTLRRFSEGNALRIFTTSCIGTHSGCRGGVTLVAILLVAVLARAFGTANRVDTEHIGARTKGWIAAFISVRTHLPRAKEPIATRTNVTSDCILAIGIFVTIMCTIQTFINFKTSLPITLKTVGTWTLPFAFDIFTDAIVTIAIIKRQRTLVNIFTFEGSRTWPLSAPIARLNQVTLALFVSLLAFHRTRFGIARVDFRSSPDFEWGWAFRRDTLSSTALVARCAWAFEGAWRVDTTAAWGNRGTIMRAIRTLVNVATLTGDNFVAWLAFALERADHVDAIGTGTGRNGFFRLNWKGVRSVLFACKLW